MTSLTLERLAVRRIQGELRAFQRGCGLGFSSSARARSARSQGSSHHLFAGGAQGGTVVEVELLQSRVLVHPMEFERAIQRCNAFGLRSIRCYGPLDEPLGIVYAAGGTCLEVSRQSGAPPRGVTLWLQVPDINAAVASLHAREYDGAVGVPVLQPWGLWECEVELFDGVDALLIEVPRGHPLHWRG